MGSGGKLVLVVDDDEVERFMLRHALERRGYIVEEAESAQDAIRCIRLAHPDALVSDVYLPGLSGLELCETIRAEPTAGRLPIILMTGSRNPEMREAAMRAGADAYLLKASDVAPIVAAVADLIAG